MLPSAARDEKPQLTAPGDVTHSALPAPPGRHSLGGMQQPAPATADPPAVATSIHVGASTVSMLVAEPDDEGGFRPLDFLEQPAPLAREIFGEGRISADTTERVVEILDGFVEAAAENGAPDPTASRAVATNILVEAANHEAFLNRVRVACGLSINPIDDGEMTRLIYLKTRRRLHDTPAMRKGTTLVVHVGPGNTRALLFQNGQISRYSNYRLGAHRTAEAIEGAYADPDSMRRMIRENASGNLAQLRYDYSDVEIGTLVAIGYEIQQLSESLSDADGSTSRKRLRQHSREASEMSDLERVNRYRVDYQTAEALVPALETNLAIAETVAVETMFIPRSDYEQGLLQDLLVSRRLLGTFDAEVLRSARILASRYQSDPRHGEHVGRIALHLFEELQELHRMDRLDALLLHVACILHEVGTFISPRAHHKHSEYIILNSEIFGLDRREVQLIALVARYHRHSGPRPDHPKYRELDTADRIRVAKLAAILRVADALERTHDQRVHEIVLRRADQRLHLSLPGVSDVAVERLAMQSKGDLFEQIFGLEVLIDDPA